ncbi:MAG: alpha/beta hydrolase, partial [Sphingobacteriaceae bacterium]
MDYKNYTISGASNKPIAIDLILSHTKEVSPLVIFVHGFKGFKDWGTHQLVGEYFARQGFHFLKFNFSHSGISAGSCDEFDDLEAFATNTFSKEIFDLNQVITFSLSGEEFTKPLNIYLIGHSLGGAISIIQASEDRAINKLATWASISSFR